MIECTIINMAILNNLAMLTNILTFWPSGFHQSVEEHGCHLIYIRIGFNSHMLIDFLEFHMYLL